MNKKILLIDDEEELLKILTMRLTANHYEVVSAHDGLTGLTMAREHLPSLIIMDVMMPKMNGYHLCRMLKFDEKYKSIPIIMLTARSTDKDMEAGKEVGCDLYLTKPFDTEKLMLEVKKLLGED